VNEFVAEGPKKCQPALGLPGFDYSSNLWLGGRNSTIRNVWRSQALLVCADESTAQMLRRILEGLGITGLRALPSPGSECLSCNSPKHASIPW